MSVKIKRLYTGQPLAAGTTAYTVGASKATELKMAFCNPSTSATATITVHVVPSGSSASAANMIENTRLLQPKETYYLDDISVETGDFIRLIAGADTTVTAHIFGREVDQ